MSLVDEDAEWRTRRISIIGAAKSFISQLSVGQDLTKVSLPSVFVYPYSALEIGASRALGNFQILQKANAQTDPALRFLGVIAYYVSGTKKECFEKKPSNSILGEEHYCSTTLDGETVHYVGEQVSHHPPITTFLAETESQKIRVLVNFETGDIKFHGNSTSVEIKGAYRVQLTNPVTGEVEEYTADKPFPGITIKNMILGTKREPWEGKTVLQCASTKLKAVIKYKEEGWSCTNVVKGKITREENGTSTPLYCLKGGVSQAIKYWKYENRKASDRQEETIVDFEALDRLKITYLPEAHWGEKNSLRVWKDMYASIVDNDMPSADAAKKKVEDAQRLRKKNGEDFVPVHFIQKEGSTLWDLKAEKVREFLKPSEDAVTPGGEKATEN